MWLVSVIVSFLLTCLLRGMTSRWTSGLPIILVSTHMPLARHDLSAICCANSFRVSTHMPLARHDLNEYWGSFLDYVSTHMPLARHDRNILCFLCNHATIYFCFFLTKFLYLGANLILFFNHLRFACTNQIMITPSGL